MIIRLKVKSFFVEHSVHTGEEKAQATECIDPPARPSSGPSDFG